MRSFISISIFLSICVSAFSADKFTKKIHCHLQNGEKFGIVEMVTHFQNQNGSYVVQAHNHDHSHKDDHIGKHPKVPKLLYSTNITTEINGQKYTRTLALVSTVNQTFTEKDINWLSTQQKDPKLIKNSPKYKELTKEWRQEYQKKLQKRAELYEDTELEYLLNLKFFHKPLKSSHKTWKKNDILDFLYRISGLQDVQQAIPLEKNFTLKNHEYNEEPPANLTLPKVAVPKVNADVKNYKLSTFIPRSCYYIEFSDIASMKTAMLFASSQFEQWSKNTYPRTFIQAVSNTLDQTGLPFEEMLKSPQKYGRIAIAGWDPYYQSGTSLLILVEKGGLEGKQEFYQREGVSVFSNSSKLISMSKKAHKTSRSLFQDPAFIHSREKLKSNNNEKFFLYLSDYWLTNFLSPRWQILSGRLAECDARIRLTEILRLATKSEHNLKTLPTIESMRETYKDHKELTWIMRDLKIKNKRVAHSEYGGLHDHPAIDQISFTKVSLHEKKTYEDFKRVYSSNWREMDPLAFQINKEKDHWFNRLYISPISRLSDFRQISQVVLKKKETHLLKEVPNSAFGLSAKFQTGLFQPMMGIKIPSKLQISLRGLDMAPHVETLKYLHKEKRKDDQWSFSRMPIMLEAPTLLVSSLRPMLGNISENQSDYKDLTTVNLDSWIYNLFLKQDDDGYTRASVNPMALLQMTKNSGKAQETSHPSDIYFYLDFLKGYMLHRYLAIELTKNRIYANWRRFNRTERITNTYGESINSAVFPQQNKNFRLEGLPSPEEKEEGYSWGMDASQQLGRLPSLIHMLKKIELFISVESNALTFDTKVFFKDVPKTETQQRRDTPNQEPQAAEPLDFDQ